jgi:cytochrome P450
LEVNRVCHRANPHASFQTMPTPGTTAAALPRTCTVDLFSDAVLTDPYRHYTVLRNEQGAVYLTECDAWALTRYVDVRRALDDWRAFSSTDGISLSATTNAATGNSPLAADPPAHRAPRRVLSADLSPKAVREAAPEIQRHANDLVERLAARGSFDAIRDLAQPFALSVLADHVGLAADSRDFLADWADAAFDIIGPDNERTNAARAHLGKLGVHLLTTTTAERLTRTGAGQAIYAAGRRGDITMEACTQLIAIYLLASIPTTTAAIGSAIWLFAHHPEQWDALRRDPHLMPQAVEEILRLESPIQSFSRVLREPCEIGRATVPSGARVLLLFGAANRDPHIWSSPDMFDIGRRDPPAHLAFGRGLHSCMGQGLARMQVTAALTALVRHVESWQTSETRWKLNNIIRGLDSLPVAINQCGTPGPLAPVRSVDADTNTEVADWRVVGTIGLAKLRQTVDLPDGATFSGNVDMIKGVMTGELNLPLLTTELRILGIKVCTTSQLIPTGTFDGDVTVKPDGTIDMRATSRAYMHIHSVAIGRLRIPLKCRTATPIEMPLESSGTMSLDFRPTFAGTMTIPRFTGNGPIEWLVTILVSGPGNAFQIALELPTTQSPMTGAPEAADSRGAQQPESP